MIIWNPHANLKNMPQYSVFRHGSKTYFNSSRFFPPDVQKDVFILYGFVRMADDFVDNIPQNKTGFQNFCNAWEHANQGKKSGNPIIDDFVDLSRRRRFKSHWVEAFLVAMNTDLGTIACNTLEETLSYIYGSAEVIGLFMSRILSLPEKSHPHARLLGRAMQYINFIRDIPEDHNLGRRYLPLGNSGLKDLSREEAYRNKTAFIEWHHQQIHIYKSWHREAQNGYSLIPRHYLLPIQTAEDMYMWTARKLEENPLLVYEQKVKPGKNRIRRRFLYNLATSITKPAYKPVNPDINGGMKEPGVPTRTQ